MNRSEVIRLSLAGIVILFAAVGVVHAAAYSNSFEDGNTNEWAITTCCAEANNSEAFDGSWSTYFAGNDVADLSMSGGGTSNWSMAIFMVDDGGLGSPSWSLETGSGSGAIGMRFRIDSGGNIEFSDSSSYTDTGIHLAEGTWYEITVQNVDYSADTYDIIVYDVNGNTVGTHENADMYSGSFTSFDFIEDFSTANSNPEVNLDMIQTDANLPTAPEASLIGGQIIREDGSPVGGVMVTADDPSGIQQSSNTTDDDGYFNLTFLPDDTYTVTASDSRWDTDTSTTITLSGNDSTGITLKMSDPSFTSTGTEFTKPFRLESPSGLFTPDGSSLTAEYWGTIDSRETWGVTENPNAEWHQEDVVEGVEAGFGTTLWVPFAPDNRAELHLHDNTFYKLKVLGDGGRWEYIGWRSDASNTSIKTIVICGPEGCPPEQITPTPTVPTPPGFTLPDFGWNPDPDFDGVIENPGPIERPEFEIPDQDGPAAYLQTGIFEIGGVRCAGVRYYDPTEETTQFNYSFTVEGTHYEDTVTFDEPVGYYQSCVDETEVGPSNDLPSEDELDLPSGNFSFDAIRNGTSFGASLDFGEPIADLPRSSLGGIGAPVGGDGGGAGSPDEPTSPLGLLFLAGGVAGSYAIRRYVPPDVLPPLRANVPRVGDIGGQVPISPATAVGAAATVGLWATGNIPDSGPALGFVGLLIYVWTDVLEGDVSRVNRLVPFR